MTQPSQRTTYATAKEAMADGWRRVNRKTDRDISGGSYFGYEYQAPNGQRSTTITLTQAFNNFGTRGCCLEMFRDCLAPPPDQT